MRNKMQISIIVASSFIQLFNYLSTAQFITPRSKTNFLCLLWDLFIANWPCLSKVCYAMIIYFGDCLAFQFSIV